MAPRWTVFVSSASIGLNKAEAVIDVEAVDLVTFVAVAAPGLALKWTEYVIASGGGSRLISYAAGAV